MANLNKKPIEDLLNLDHGITVMIQAVTANDNFIPQYLDTEWKGIYYVLDFQLQVQKALKARINEYIPDYVMDSEKIEGTVTI